MMSPKAQVAFEDYWALGDNRSLNKLVELYQGKHEKGETVPTLHRRQLGEWSSKYNWQGQIAKRIEEEANQRRIKLRKRADKMRDSVMTGLEVSISRLLKELFDKDDKKLVNNLGDIGQAVKLFFQLAEDPLAEKHEIESTGQIQHEFNPIADPAIRELSLALVARTPDGETDASEPGDATE